MKQNTFYFSHDFTARSDEKIKLLLMKWGMAGYGVYWSIVEDLYQNANAMRTHTERIAYELRVPENMVQSILNDFDLFVFNGDFFGSLSIQRRMDERLQKSTKARESANYRWEKMRTQCERIETGCEGNAIKERKGKEKKRKENKIKEKQVKEKNEIPAQPGVGDAGILNEDVLKGNTSPQAYENTTDSTYIPTEVQTPVKTQENGYSDFVAEYKSFIEGRGLPFRFSSTDGKQIKQIISYLSNIPTNNGKPPIEAFRFILNNWSKLSAWLQTQTQLRQINSQLPNIIETLKQQYNGTTKGIKTQQSMADFARALRDRIENGSGL